MAVERGRGGERGERGERERERDRDRDSRRKKREQFSLGSSPFPSLSFFLSLPLQLAAMTRLAPSSCEAHRGHGHDAGRRPIKRKLEHSGRETQRERGWIYGVLQWMATATSYESHSEERGRSGCKRTAGRTGKKRCEAQFAEEERDEQRRLR